MWNRITVSLLMGGAFTTYMQLAFASIVPQAASNPIPINQTSTTDNVQVLLATLAERTSDIQELVNPTEESPEFQYR